MLTITIPASYDLYDEVKEEFICAPEVTVDLEHSLISVSKWEAKYKKPYLSSDKTPEENFEYIKMMSLTEGVTDDQWRSLTADNIKAINEYIDDKQTATTISKDQQGKSSREIVTSELIYCWMVLQQIPFECQHWHLNRLLTLINVVSIKNQPPKKTSQADAVSRHRAIKQAHRANKKPHIHRH